MDKVTLYTARSTKAKLIADQIAILNWPLNSLNLNPVKAL